MYKIIASSIYSRGTEDHEYTGFNNQEEAKAKINEMIDMILETIEEPDGSSEDATYYVQDEGSSVGLHDYVNDITYVYKIVEE